jgi:tetratricopeptide (TPR) repeat protein
MTLIEQEHKAGRLPTQQAIDSLKAVERLVPELPHPRLARARLTFEAEPARLPEAARAWSQGVKLGLQRPETVLPATINMVMLATAAALATALLFLLGQVIRQLGIVAYDLARALPAGFSSNQATILLLAAILLPGLLTQSPLLAGVTLLVILSLVQLPAERAVTIALCALLATLPLVDELVARRLLFVGSPEQALMNAQHGYCPKSCIEALPAALDHDKPLLTYTRALARWRAGELDAPLALAGELESWPDAMMRGRGYNLLGAALLAAERGEEAIAALDKAEQLDAMSAAPAFNAMRAHQLLGQTEAANQALTRANNRDLYAVSDRIELKRRDHNTYLLVEPLPAMRFWQAAERRLATEPAPPIIGQLWPYIAGPNLPLQAAHGLGALGIVLAIAGAGLVKRGKTSTPCPRCGMARDPHDAKHTGGHPECLLCYQTFVGGVRLDFGTKLAAEKLLQQRSATQRTMRRVGAAILPGTGHFLAGRAVEGVLIAWGFIFGAALLYNPAAVWRPPADLRGHDWTGLAALGWAPLALTLIASLYAASRGVAPVYIDERHEEGRR